jgi:DeoR/GlpR family transcriptional regulator of sugar metabolism
MIARKVARFVPNGVSIAFSIGTTPEIVAEALLAHVQLRIRCAICQLWQWLSIGSELINPSGYATV